jgi:tetratricopeptide (TPR) repeat protein
VPSSTQVDGWASEVRQYAAIRSIRFLERAISKAADGTIADLLRAYKRRDRAEVDRLVAALEPSEQDSEASLTVRLIQLDIVTDLAIANDLSSESRTVGLEACKNAIEVSERLRDAGCIAFFADRLAEGLFNSGAIERALSVYQSAVQGYRWLAKQSDLYQRRLAATLSRQGYAFQKLHDLPMAREAFEDAVHIWNALAQREPQVHRQDLAWSLSSLGNVLLKAGELEKSRDACVKGLQLFRALAQEDPQGYRAYLRWSLASLGEVLVDIQEFDKAAEIWRELVREEPEEYQPELASTLTELSNVFVRSGKLESAREACEEAVQICRELAYKQPRRYLSDLALVLNILGTIFGQLGQFARARDTGEAAVRVAHELVREAPQKYGPILAASLTVLGNAYRELGEPEDQKRACKALQEAAHLSRKFASEGSGQSGPELAVSLTSLGNALQESGELGEASDTLREAVEIWRILLQTDAEVHLPMLATTLTSLGSVFVKQGEFNEARNAYVQALQVWGELPHEKQMKHMPDQARTMASFGTVLYEMGHKDKARETYSLALSVFQGWDRFSDAAVCCQDWALQEWTHGNPAEALRIFGNAVCSVEMGLGKPSEITSRDKRKVSVNVSYQILISQHATNGQWEEKPHEFVGLLESQRRVELFSGFERSWSPPLSWYGTAGLPPPPAPRVADEPDPGPPGWQLIFDGIRHDDVTSAAAGVFLRHHRAAFLWIHCTGTRVVFALLAPNRWNVYVADDLLPKLDALRNEVSERLGSTEFERRVREGDRAPVLGDALPDLGHRAFQSLPREIQEVLTSQIHEVIFLAPCPTTMNLSFELLAPEKGEYLGLDRLFVRTHGLSELEQVLQRSPKNKSAFLVGNPMHHEKETLPEAERAVIQLYEALKEREWDVQPPLIGKDASEQAVCRELTTNHPALWVYAGHGEKQSLVLANEDFLPQDKVANQKWQSQPLAHYDCCYSGDILARGGGRFEGHPTAALFAGASAVLSSAHLLRDKTASDFSRHFYEALFAGTSMPGNRTDVGSAVLTARRRIHSAYGQNPLLWATTVLWGNPWVQLPS